MKVVQIVTQMEAAGAQKVAYLVHEGLKTQLDSELWFLYTKRAAYAGLDGVRSLLDHPPRGIEYGCIAARLYGWLRQSRPDVVITHTQYSNVLGQTIARIAGVPRRIAVHHNPLQANSPMGNRIDRFLGKTGTYSNVVAVSKSVEATLRDYPEPYLRRLSVIQNGLDISAGDPSLDVRQRCGISSATPLLVSVGRLSKPKNHVLLLRSLRDIPEAYLAILGAGELREELVALAENLGISHRVYFAGEVPPEEVSSFLHACNAFVFPSLHEGLPLAAIEAMHAGAPIVASDIAATREVVGDAALMFPVHDAAALSAGIRRILTDPALALELKDRARKRSAQFTAGRMVSRYCRLIYNEPLAAPAES